MTTDFSFDGETIPSSLHYGSI